MKKLSLAIVAVSFLLEGCQSCILCNKNKPTTNEAPVAETQIISDENKGTQIKYYVVEQNPSCISEVAAIKAPLATADDKVDDGEYKSFSRRIAIKGSSDNFVTYEYRDIRVDELMPLAARYCREHGERTALLRKINLYHGYSRRVTFDCVRL